MSARNFWENFIIVAIILVIIQTFLDDFSVYMDWSIKTRNILLLSALFFDFLFTVEFIVRSILANKKGSIKQYILYERGWVDFLSSVPLLLLNSGPSVLLLVFGVGDEILGMGNLNVIKVVKAIRVTRILRLIRVIKIFGKIQNAESPMTQHHTSVISTTAVFTMICIIFFFSIVTTTPVEQNELERKIRYEKSLGTIRYINNVTHGLSSRKIIKKVLKNDKNVIKVLCRKEVLLSNIDNKRFKEYYKKDIDYRIIKKRDVKLFVSFKDINKQEAYTNLIYFFIIVLTVLAFMIVYTKHFAQTISDLVHVMNKGFRKKGYNLQVKIRDEYKDEEISRLARFYNDFYLPAKIKKIQEEDTNKQSDLSMDILDGFKKRDE